MKKSQVNCTKNLTNEIETYGGNKCRLLHFTMKNK